MTCALFYDYINFSLKNYIFASRYVVVQIFDNQTLQAIVLDKTAPFFYQIGFQMLHAGLCLNKGTLNPNYIKLEKW